MTAYEVDSLWLGVLSGMAAGALVALLMALMSVTFRLDQVVSGLAINVLAAGLTFYLFRVSFSDLGEQNLPNVSTFGPVEIPGLSDIPLVGEVLFSQPPLTYLALLAVPLTALFLGRTRHGLEIRVIGENPRAADMRGVNVSARQYAAVLFGGVMAGMAGAFLTLDSAGLFVPNISGGRGFIAFALGRQLVGMEDPVRLAVLRRHRFASAPAAGGWRRCALPAASGPALSLDDRRAGRGAHPVRRAPLPRVRTPASPHGDVCRLQIAAAWLTVCRGNPGDGHAR
jgi:ABC-type uncharacterized transport system permease subunit